MRIFASIALVLACVAPAAAEIPGPDDAAAVSGIVQDRLNATDINFQMVAEKPYVIASWTSGKNYAAGQALAKKGKGGWTIVKTTNAKFTAAALTSLGVPAATVKALVADLKVAHQ
jgi:hypothetical protein